MKERKDWERFLEDTNHINIGSRHFFFPRKLLGAENVQTFKDGF